MLLTVDNSMGHPVYASVGSVFRVSLFLPTSNTAYWMLCGPLCNLQRANSKQADGWFVGLCSRRDSRWSVPVSSCLLQQQQHPGHRQRRWSYKAESFATTDTDTRGCCEDIAKNKQSRRICDFKRSQKKINKKSKYYIFKKINTNESFIR